MRLLLLLLLLGLLLLLLMRRLLLLLLFLLLLLLVLPLWRHGGGYSACRQGSQKIIHVVKHFLPRDRSREEDG